MLSTAWSTAATPAATPTAQQAPPAAPPMRPVMSLSIAQAPAQLAPGMPRHLTAQAAVAAAPGCRGGGHCSLYTITYGRSSATGAANSTAATSAHVAPNFAADAAAFTAPDLAAGVSVGDPQDVGVQGGRKIYTPKCGVCKAGRCQAVPASSGTYTCVAAG